jgi:hypothetical protein
MKPLKISSAETPPVLLTLDEARASLRVGKKTFSDLREAGLIETVAIGRSVRVVAESIRALPDRLRSTSDTAAA